MWSSDDPHQKLELFSEPFRLGGSHHLMIGDLQIILSWDILDVFQAMRFTSLYDFTTFLTQIHSQWKMSSVKRLDSEVLEAFKLFDKDQDGTITRDEIEGLVKNLGGDSSNPIIKVGTSDFIP